MQNHLFTIEQEYEQHPNEEEDTLYDIRYYNNTFETLKQCYPDSELPIMFLKKACKRVSLTTLSEAIMIVSEEYMNIIIEILSSETAIGCGCCPNDNMEYVISVLNSSHPYEEAIKKYNNELLHSAVKLLTGRPLTNERFIDITRIPENIYNYIVYSRNL